MSKINNEYRIVSSSVASIYDKPTFDSELITQALIWEQLIICDKKKISSMLKELDSSAPTIETDEARINDRLIRALVHGSSMVEKDYRRLN